MSLQTLIVGFDIESDWTPEETSVWIAQYAIATPLRPSATDIGKPMPDGRRLMIPADGIFTGRGALIDYYHTQCDVLDTFETLLQGYKTLIVTVHNLNFDFRFLLEAIESRYLALIDEKQESGYRITYRNSKIISAGFKFKDRWIKFHDTSLLHPGTSVEDLGKLLGSPKLDSPGFYPGWSRDHTDLKYVKQDAEIIRRIRKMDYDQGMTQATASSYAWTELKKSINKVHSKRFITLFPEMLDVYDEFSRLCYVGGFNFSGNQGWHEGPIYHADINSSYPDKYRNYPLPYGHPLPVETMPDYGYWEGLVIARITVKDGCVAWYTPKRISDLADENIYREKHGLDELETGEGVEYTYTRIKMTINSIDWETLNENYDLHDTEFGEMFLSYKTQSGILKEYCDEHMAEKSRLKQELKQNPSDPLLQLKYEQVKYKLNMPSGRFGLRREADLAYIEWGKIETIKDEDITDSYVPFISAICAHGRQQVIRALNTVNPDKRYHVDTDSVIAGEKPDVPFSAELGDWELDMFDGIYEGGMKKYIEVTGKDYPLGDFKLNVVCAGVPQKWYHDKVPIGMHVELLDTPELICENYTLGMEGYSVQSQWIRDLYEEYGMDPDNVDTRKLLPKRLTTGVILRKTTYKLHEGSGYEIKIGRKAQRHDQYMSAYWREQFNAFDDDMDDMNTWLEDIDIREKDSTFRRTKSNIVKAYRETKWEAEQMLLDDERYRTAIYQ